MRIDPGCAGEHFDHLLRSQGSGEHGAASAGAHFEDQPTSS
jgi:hypothetical protein